MTSPVAIVTGVSGGLGRAIARCFKENGFRVCGISRSKPDIELDLWISCDITFPAQRAETLRQFSLTFDRLDVLINCAGVGAYATWEELSSADLRQLFEVDFFAAVAMTESVLPLLKKSSGSIINISSAAGKLPIPCMGSYCAAKSALSMFSNTLGIELKKSKIQVLDVTPGQINTGFSLRAFGNRQVVDSPGGNATTPEKLARKIFNARRKKKRHLSYPGYVDFAIFFLRTLLFPLYRKISIRLWKLDD